MAMTGGIKEIPVDSPEILELTKVVLSKLSEGDSKEKTLVEVIKAGRQVVSGILTHLTMKISDGGQHRTCEVKIWEQPWLNKTEITNITFLDEDN